MWVGDARRLQVVGTFSSDLLIAIYTLIAIAEARVLENVL